jgi:hypothetical protein
MAVVARRHGAAVQVDVGLEGERVVLADDRLAALARADRRTRVDALWKPGRTSAVPSWIVTS